MFIVDVSVAVNQAKPFVTQMKNTMARSAIIIKVPFLLFNIEFQDKVIHV